MRTYSELITLPSFKDRYEYLRLRGNVGVETFGHERWMNQNFYTSSLWRNVRDRVIARDLGLDLGCEGYEIWDRVIIHHMNPISSQDLVLGNPMLLNLENLICTSFQTHNAIHYGEKTFFREPYKPRTPGDTKLW